jgi:hypothetical protein
MNQHALAPAARNAVLVGGEFNELWPVLMQEYSFSAGLSFGNGSGSILLPMFKGPIP